MKPERTHLWAERGAGVAGAALGAGSAAAEGLEAGVVVAMAVLGACVGIGRSHPRAAWIVAAVAMAITSIGFAACPGAYLLVLPAVAFCAARWDDNRAGIVALVVLVGLAELGVYFAHDAGVPALLLPAAGWGAGRALRQRELVAAELAERVRELEEEREAYSALSVRYERARIASELHDIVAHAISVMVVQASAGQRIAAHDPELTAETFSAIAGAAREAEEDMGRLVALLADRDAIAQAPDLALVEELVQRAAGSGLDVRLRLEGEREGLPAPVVQVAYRVVQEGLTNALRYASGAAVSVVVRGERDGLTVEVENGPAGSDAALAGTGTGNGIRGLRERVSALGGSVEAGPAAGGGWRLSARLPAGIGKRADGYRGPQATKGDHMADATGDKAKGSIKKAGGELTGDNSLKNEGRVDKASGNVKDAVNSVTDKVKDTLRKD